MTDRYRKKDQNPPLSHAREPLPDDFKGPERRDMERIWDGSADTAFRHEYPDAEQTNDALKSVHHRLGFSKADAAHLSESDALSRSDSGNESRSKTAAQHGIDTDKKPRTAAKPRFLHRLPVYIAAAAVALLAFGLGYLLYPQSVTAPNGQRAAAVLPDGSTAELNSGTTIQYNRLFGIRNREVRLDGEAFFSVAPDDKPFIVSANRAVVEVTGTAFNVRSRSDDPGYETRVHVASGSVALYPAGHSDRSVTLSAGDWSRWNITMETPQIPGPAAPENIGEWRDNRFHFRSETLGMIFREIERRFDIRIQLEAEQAASEVLTAHYTDPGDAKRIIEDICHVKGLRYAPTANGFRIYRQPATGDNTP